MKSNIIYIEDEIESMHTFCIVFEKYYNVYLASTKENVFQILEEEAIKVVLVDQRMPEISGLELCTMIHEKYAEILCIMVTAYFDANVMQEAINQGGIFQLIIKPWDNEALKQIIDNAIEKFDLKQENKKLFNDLAQKNKELEEKNEILTITAEVLKDNEEELVNYNRELLKSKEYAEQSDRLKSSFLANISHEIKTPLNGILGFIELLSISKDDNLSKRGKNFIKIIKSSSEQLLSIINDLIDISKIESGKILVKKENFDLIKVIDTISNTYESKLKQNNIKLKVINRLPTNIVESDKHKVKQVIKHLVDNAIKYTQKGSIEIHLERNKNNFNEILIGVKDTGIGISEKDYDDIWRRFIQLDLDNLTVNHGGGVGLSLVKSFIELLGGKVWVESKLNEGSSFYFNLPIHQHHDSYMSKLNNISLDSILQLKVLIVEGESSDSNYICSLLSDIVKKLVVTAQGEEAIELATEQDFDLIIINTNLSGINGEKAAKFIQKIKPNTTIIGQAKYSFENKENVNFDAIIYSPFSKSQLIEKINEAILYKRNKLMNLN